VIAKGRLAASGTLDEVRGQGSLEDAFVQLVGARITTEGLSWLAS
jgi:ABC-2 type transport system ATP-binding protein